MQGGQYFALQIRLEINEQIAATNQVHAREGRVAQQILAGKDEHLADKLGHPVAAGLLLGAGRFRTSRTHSDSLLDTPHFGAARGVEVVDVTDPLVISRQPRQLVVDARARRFRLSVEGLQDLAVAHGE